MKTNLCKSSLIFMLSSWWSFQFYSTLLSLHLQYFRAFQIGTMDSKEQEPKESCSVQLVLVSFNFCKVIQRLQPVPICEQNFTPSIDSEGFQKYGIISFRKHYAPNFIKSFAFLFSINTSCKAINI